jgi:hypothetical protein
LAGVFPSEPGTFFILFWTLSVDIFVKIRPHVSVLKKFDFAANLQKDYVVKVIKARSNLNLHVKWQM